MKKILLTFLLFFTISSAYADSKVFTPSSDQKLIDKVHCYGAGGLNNLYIYAKTKANGYYTSSDNHLVIDVIDSNGNNILTQTLSNGDNRNSGYTKVSIVENIDHTYYVFQENTSYYSYYSSFNIGFVINKNGCTAELLYAENNSTGYGKLGLYKTNVIWGLNNENTSYIGYIDQYDNIYKTGGLDITNADIQKTNTSLYYIDIDNHIFYIDKVYSLGFYNNYFRHYDKTSIVDTYYDNNGIKTDYAYSTYSGTLDYYKFQIFQNYEGSEFLYLSNINNLYYPNNLAIPGTGNIVLTISGSINSDGEYEMLGVDSDPPYAIVSMNKILIGYNQDNIYTYDYANQDLAYLNNGIYNGIGIVQLNGIDYLSYALSDGLYIRSLSDDPNIGISENPNSGSEIEDGEDIETNTDGTDSFFTWDNNPFSGLFDSLTNVGDTNGTITKTTEIGSGYINIGNSLQDIGEEVQNTELDIDYSTGGISDEGNQIINALQLKQDKVQGSFAYSTYLILKIFLIIIIIIIIIVLIITLL